MILTMTILRMKLQRLKGTCIYDIVSLPLGSVVEKDLIEAMTMVLLTFHIWIP